jgi:hypothetical protein
MRIAKIETKYYRKMEDNFLDEAFNNFHRPTEKKFSDVFRIEQTKLGNQIITLLAVKVGDKQLNKGLIILNGDLTINGTSVYNLLDKSLIGTTSLDNNVFNITGFKD